MGHIDFDGVRYWDLRDEEHSPKQFKPYQLVPNSLPSDSTSRPDRNKLVENDYDAAQEEKENLEQL